MTRVAAAAFLAIILGGAVVYHQAKPAAAAIQPAKTTAAANSLTLEDMHAPINPWQSEELKQFHEVVQWESWVDGDDSL